MGIFGAPSAQTPPPPPPVPPAANPPTYASSQPQAAGAAAKARAANAAGSGFNGTDLTAPMGSNTGVGPTAKAQLLGSTASG